MYQMSLTGLGILLIMASWRFMLKPSQLDRTRDRLFDLRDEELRSGFLKHEEGLNHPLYIKLRDLLNDHLRYTNKITFAEYVLMVLWMKRNHETVEKALEKHKDEYLCDDASLNELSREIRLKASGVMIVHMVESSFWAKSVLFVLGGFFRIFLMIKTFSHFKSKGQFMKPATIFSAAIMVALHFAPNTDMKAYQIYIEEMSAKNV